MMIGHPTRHTPCCVIATLGSPYQLRSGIGCRPEAPSLSLPAPAARRGLQFPIATVRIRAHSELPQLAARVDTLVIESGHLRTAAIVSRGIFEVPDGYRQI